MKKYADATAIDFLAKVRVNFYFITGYVFDLNNNLKLKPPLLTKVVAGAPLQVDVSANFLFAEKFSFGAVYRWDAAVSAFAGFQINDQILLGLAYDRETTDFGAQRFSNGSFCEGFGETKLINNCANGIECPAVQHEMNRRSEFIILE